MTHLLGSKTLNGLRLAGAAALAAATALSAPVVASQADYSVAFAACEAAIAADAGVAQDALVFDVRGIRSSGRATKVIYRITRADGGALERASVECKVSKRSGEVSLEDA